MIKRFKKNAMAFVGIVVFAFAMVISSVLLLRPDVDDSTSASQETTKVTATTGEVTVSDPPSGTLTDPYLIGDAATLRSTLETHAGTVNKGYRLTANITLTESWLPIPLFADGSVFDGNGFTINGLTVDSATAVRSRGMFANFRGTMQNVVFENVSIQGGEYAGVIAGWIGSNSTATNPTESQVGGSIGTVSIMIDNVQIRSGNIGRVTMPTWRTGGFIGGTLAGGTSTSARYTLTIKNSYNNMEEIRGGNSSGGFIGHVRSANMNLYISNSFQNGNVHNDSNIVGGIVGTFGLGTNRAAVIENCFARGRFRAEGTFAGGIVGWIGHNVTNLTIRNCFADANVTSASGPDAGIFGGTEVSSYGAAVYIQNCYFNSERMGTTVVAGGSYVPSGNITSSGPRTLAQMKTQAFIDQLNRGAGSEVFVLDDNGNPQLRIFTSVTPMVFLTFNANGGAFTESDPNIFEGSWEENSTIAAGEVPQPRRFAWTFSGWNTQADGSGQNYATAAAVPTSTNRTFYARWTKVAYSVFAEIPAEMKTPEQTQTIVFAGTATPLTPTYTVEQQGHIETYLLNDDSNISFLGFEVLKAGESKDDPANWVSIGTGYVPENPKFHENRINLYDEETGEYLIDETFIRNYADGTNNIWFRAVYVSQQPIRVTFELVGQQWGTVRVDGAVRPLSAPNNVIQYVFDYTNPMEIEVTPNNYRTVEALEESTDGGATWNPIGTAEGKLLMASQVPVDGMKIRVKFGTEPITMRVITNITLASGDTSMADAIEGTSVQTIGLGTAFGGVTLNSVPGYRLVSTLSSNIKIANTQTGLDEFFNALDGVISFTGTDVNENFLNKFVVYDNDGNGFITVIAIYVKQFELIVNVDTASQNLGSVRYTVTLPNGTPLYPSELEVYDEGTIIEIRIQPNNNAMIESIKEKGNNLPSSELNAAGNIVTIYLTENREISIRFTITEYVISTWAVDQNGDTLGQIKTSITAPDVAAGATAGPFFRGGVITLITVSEYDEAEFEFIGWYALVDGKMKPLGALINIHDFILSDANIRDFATGKRFEFVAQFGAVHAAVFNVEGSGTFRATVVKLQEGEWVAVQGQSAITAEGSYAFVQGTYLKIEATPAECFELLGIEGLKTNETIDGNTVVIMVDGFRTMFVIFKEKQYDIKDSDVVFDLRAARGTGRVAATTMALNEKISIIFEPQGGFQLTKVRINGKDIDDLGNVERVGNVITLTVTDTWLADWGTQLNISMTTTMNQVFLFGMLAALILIPVIVAGAILIYFSNAKKKKEYEKLLEQRKMTEGMLSSVDKIKKLRGEE